LALPLCGALLMLVIGRKLPHAVVSVICCGTILGSFALAASALMGLREPLEIVLGPWIPALRADWGFLFDHLSGTFAVVITGIGFLIHVYSVGYMKEDAGYYRYFGYLNFFVFAMLLLVLANNYVLMFAGWEGVGLASYLLIGFWFHRPAAARAGMKAFVVNRVGDAGFMLAMFLIWTLFGTTRFSGIQIAIPELRNITYDAICLLLVLGAIGKSAQFPLHVWLPDAMEGPTPVSALIHAATMVTAGVYLIARSRALFLDFSPALATLGAFTAIFAASVALAQNDIKRVLAWSTISQLGYMFLALGTGAYWVAIFHMLTHAFFKALLFLSAGNVIHALYGEQDLRKMGGLRKALPKTHALMFIGAASAAGVPGLAGFFSKDAVLASAWSAPVLYVVGLATALLTAFYMWRLMYLTFYGRAREEHLHAHEPSVVMIAPLSVLAVGSIAAGWFAPQAFLAPVLGEHRESGAPEYLLMGLSAFVALAGWWLAQGRYLNQWPKFLQRAYFLDEIYDRVFVRGLALGGGRLLNAVDSRVVDGGVNGAAWLTRAISHVSIWWDTWIVDGLVRLTGFLVKMSSYPVRFTQSGYVQFYALVTLVGLITFVGYLFAR
jgi:NADH-quinone oxidoreductase subunit L